MAAKALLLLAAASHAFITPVRRLRPMQPLRAVPLDAIELTTHTLAANSALTSTADELARQFVRRLFIAVARDALLAEAPEDAGAARRLFRLDLSPSVCVRVHPGGHRRGRAVWRVARRRRLAARRRRISTRGDELCGCIRFSGRARGKG